MRCAGALAMLVVLAPWSAAAQPASPTQQPQARVSTALLVAASVWNVGPLSFAGTGADLEVAAGIGKRGQLYLESFISRLGDEPSELLATHARAGIGARWIPRAFHPDRNGAIELYVEGGTGVQRTWWDGGGRLTRQDLTVGTGMQVRLFAAHGLTFRAGIQFVWAEPPPLARLERAVCRGSCPDAGQAAPVDFAFMSQFGLAWGR